jgi:hypothetical protein
MAKVKGTLKVATYVGGKLRQAGEVVEIAEELAASVFVEEKAAKDKPKEVKE